MHFFVCIIQKCVYCDSCRGTVPRLDGDTDMITATFSNGHTDTYKGKRDVKAAWMVITADGKIHSGHSLDRAAAEGTARTYLGHGCQITALRMSGTRGRDITTPAFAAYAHKIAVSRGFADRKAHNVYADAERAAYMAQGKIEIIDL